MDGPLHTILAKPQQVQRRAGNAARTELALQKLGLGDIVGREKNLIPLRADQVAHQIGECCSMNRVIVLQGIVKNERLPALLGLLRIALQNLVDVVL